jgi:gluconate 2-dehydrogenase gamma chain
MIRLSNLSALARAGEVGAPRPAIDGEADRARGAGLSRGAASGSRPARITLAASVTRRRVLKMMAGAALLAFDVLSLPRLGRARRRRVGRFFTRHEYATVEAATARFFPTDDTPGAREAGAVDYIDALLAALDARVPRVFAGGPFSGRTPYPDLATGTPSVAFPRNDFRRFVPLSRVERLAWRALLRGSARVRGARFNDAVLGPLPGLREVYRAGVAQLDAAARAFFAAPFVDLTPAQQDEVLADAADPARHPRHPRSGRNFFDHLLAHTAEGMFCAPEYGGNRDRIGWRLIAFEGDSQPLGYSLFDAGAGAYRERAEAPMSEPNPDEVVDGMLVPEGLSPDAEAFAALIVGLLGGFDASESARG